MPICSVRGIRGALRARRDFAWDWSAMFRAGSHRLRDGGIFMLTNSLSIVIPVYNSEKSLPVLLERLGPLLPTLASQFEVILVNDNSSDGSGLIVDWAVQEHDWVVGIHLMRNFGQQNALLSGIRETSFETIVTMDDDLQNPPDEIPRLLTKLAEGFDVVYGFPRQ